MFLLKLYSVPNYENKKALLYNYVQKVHSVESPKEMGQVKQGENERVTTNKR
jgi:hypothetical protein